MSLSRRSDTGPLSRAAHPFNWPLFALGETISLAAFVFAPWSVNARR